MAPNFIECDREQSFLLPPSLLDWVPQEHRGVDDPGCGGGDGLTALWLAIGRIVMVGRRMTRR
jgi:hypothetical protein